ncbi:MAG: bis(5'-nucleosyl)-tetraphosphatase [Candidatus Methylomirabilales bacterium]
MGREVSAGVILFRQRGEREYLLLDYGSHWDFPKGHVEAGEDPAATARRELAEETGIREARFVPGFTEQMRYVYRRGADRILKVVTYFLAETGDGHVILSHEHCGYAWLPVEPALARLTFKTARDLLLRAEQFLGPRLS